ncbi:D-alanyl-D-alanine carboxypeptidase/D-alanyl-D-alanine-endopeptidase [Haloferula chungangensis]|uniref:D-alanyl-D-alanine carboxypeptidase/D-alanyl-D-alanine-endopeptidase n=1 Tax=Haloferula chungangensis TaxID=1048331 RepID=A0ABW2L8D3_9BACT
MKTGKEGRSSVTNDSKTENEVVEMERMGEKQQAMAKNILIFLLSAGLAVCGWFLWQKPKSVRETVVVEKVVEPERVVVLEEPEDEVEELPVPEVRWELVDPLQELVDRAEADLAGGVVGFCLLDGEGKVLSQRNGETPMIPASTFKTLTTVAALDLLGPDFKFTTKVVSAKAVAGKIVGNLMVRGGGDPMLAMGDLEAWADALKKAGVTAIEGGVVGDGSIFPPSMAGDFWGWGDVGNGYGSPTSGLNLEHNRFVAGFRPGKSVGEAAEFLGPQPEVPGVEWLNQVKTGASGSGDGVMVYGGPLATRMLLTGTVPMGGDFGVRAAVPDPPMFAAFHLDRLLKERGITLGKGPRAGGLGEGVEALEGEKVWVVHESPSLADILPGLHGRSDNHETECLFQMMGVKVAQPAAEVLKDYWEERGVERIRVVDGSGLSRADFVSAESLARVQWVASRGTEATVYRDSLSAAHDGKVHWKGGAMSSVRSWTGYVQGAAGETLSFGLIFNHYQDGSRLDYWRDEIMKAITAGE